jgi:hypothetical protein
LSAGAALLFRDVKTAASIAEKNMIFQDLNLKLSPDRKSFVLDEFAVHTQVFPVDMNKDGQEELFVIQGSSALFGHTGQGFGLYMKDKAGTYRQQPEMGGAGIPIILSVKNLGYPDILIGGPGFEFPVYRWNGRNYAYHRKMKDQSLNSKNSTDIETYSISYTGSH